jgi:hypothetical protein
MRRKGRKEYVETEIDGGSSLALSRDIASLVIEQPECAGV